MFFIWQVHKVIYATSGNGDFSKVSSRNANVIFYIEKANYFVAAGQEGIFVFE